MRPHHRRTPAAADVEQRHPGLQAELAQRQVDLGELGLFQRHVVALEVGAAVGLGRVQPQPEELVGQVVVGLDVLEMRLQAAGSCHYWVPFWLYQKLAGVIVDYS